MEQTKKPTRTDKLAVLYQQAGTLNEDIPMELMQKLTVYGQILELVGRFHSESVQAWKLAEANRREAIARAMIYGVEIPGVEIKTAADRTAAAECAGFQARKDEAKAEGEAMRWKNAYNSTSEQIQIMKKRYEHLVNVAKGGI